MAIYYLDQDDEITAAAQRIRESGDSRIALVVQSGSRVATSRINFRLLAREARHHNRRLAIVAADASVRALAQTAGLPVFATVGEYQKSEAAQPRHGAGDATADALDQLAATVDAAGVGGAAAGAVAGGGRGRAAGSSTAGGAVTGGVVLGRPSRVAGAQGEASFRFSRRWLALVGVAALVIAVLGCYVLLPGATVALNLREEAVTPVTFTATVDPGLTSPDVGANAVPAVANTFPVTASGVFKATGQNVIETAAIGKVTFTSVNTILDVPVLAGTQVSTAKGIAFTTTATVTVRKATVSGLNIKPGSVDVGIVAVVKGVSGNVAAGAIVKVPSDLAAALVGPQPVKPVTNKSATTGGTHTVTLFVQQSDVDAAEANLSEQLDSAFRARLADPSASAAGAELFAPGARLGQASFSPDPASLLGKTQDEFELAADGTGTALSATTASLQDLAARKVAAMVKAGYVLVPGSVSLSLGAASAAGDAVKVTVTARAFQVPDVDVGDLKAAIKGMTATQAEAYLSRYGTADVSIGPFWSSTVPGFDFRIDVRLVTPTPAPSPSGSATVKATARHSGIIPARSPTSAPTATPEPTPTPTPTPAPTPAPSPSATAGGSASPTPASTP